jgi:hypothetical protein
MAGALTAVCTANVMRRVLVDNARAPLESLRRNDLARPPIWSSACPRNRSTKSSVATARVAVSRVGEKSLKIVPDISGRINQRVFTFMEEYHHGKSRTYTQSNI